MSRRLALLIPAVLFIGSAAHADKHETKFVEGGKVDTLIHRFAKEAEVKRASVSSRAESIPLTLASYDLGTLSPQSGVGIYKGK
jgi:hypothetical protein